MFRVALLALATLVPAVGFSAVEEVIAIPDRVKDIQGGNAFQRQHERAGHKGDDIVTFKVDGKTVTVKANASGRNLIRSGAAGSDVVIQRYKDVDFDTFTLPSIPVYPFKYVEKDPARNCNSTRYRVIDCHPIPANQPHTNNPTQVRSNTHQYSRGST
ncbi:MAG: hypothetical protein AAGB19_19645 [Cyanobacteria bacterium P01_F01_bin.3]